MFKMSDPCVHPSPVPQIMEAYCNKKVTAFFDQKFNGFVVPLLHAFGEVPCYTAEHIFSPELAYFSDRDETSGC